ncbi:uncharacterized protein KGF55_000065 [Candida pseudojiufengensis]|uniref:uncharacterized protein n=1 Tax=Candida pseudojiufengensis TaxID=497109 RepID=UPI0022249787|nr:uncharacterized protein KGF55_000065 [Candida pseudojiufengensis]KAI5967833.1 hypothetical protein KGF55_000065 [Candida pseudojiufengensis]
MFSTPTSSDHSNGSARINESDSNQEHKPPAKKKKRSLGTFPCQHCNKVFSRSDHLARHNLNHEPKEVYVCDFQIIINGESTKCGKTFVRKDLKERHIKRHYEIIESETNGGTKSSPTPNKGKRIQSNSVNGKNSEYNQLQPPYLNSPHNIFNHPQHQQVYYPNQQNFSNFPNTNLPSHAAILSPYNNQNYGSGSSNGSSPKYPTTTQVAASSNQTDLSSLFKTYGTTLPQSDIITWLFNDNYTAQQSSNYNKAAPIPSTITQSGPNSIPSLQTSQQIPQISSPSGGSDISPATHNFNNNLHSNARQINDHSFTTGTELDANVFSQEVNPLDDLFFTNYQSFTINGRQPYAHNDDTLPNSQYLALTTTTSNSPTTTMESNGESNAIVSDVTTSEESNFVYHSEFINIETNLNVFIDTTLVNVMLNQINIKSSDLPENGHNIENKFSYYLSSYWKHFHPEFPILHKPSFCTKSTHPLLLLSMIVVGSQYSFPENARQQALLHHKSYEFKLSSQLAKPLRFALFMNEDFKSPVKVWILQSLNMLEWVEKNFLSRRMHERAHLHHGTTVQLLRRSPIMGGNPATMQNRNASNSSSAGEESDANEIDDENKNTSTDELDHDLFNQWLESESIKRATFMTFYLDIIDYIKFRHNPQIMFYQLQLLNLPCNDEHLWESKDINGSFKRLVKKQKKLQDTANRKKSKSDSFLTVLKKLIRQDKTLNIKSSSPFTQKIMLAGLTSLMHQMQLVELQNNSSLIATSSNSIGQSRIWKDILTRAFDHWNFEVMQVKDKSHQSNGILSIYSIPHKKVSLPIFYLTQIIGLSEINHYDIAIFGGSPANQSVSATMKDHYIVQRKMNKLWSSIRNNQNNFRSIIYCYIFLWQLILDENGNSLEWEPNKDYYDSSNAVSIATLILWSYCFTMCGLESGRHQEIENDKFTGYDRLIQLSAEEGHKYLNRIKQEFLTNLRKLNLHKEFDIDSYHGTKHHEIINKYCELLPSISNKQNISGLCFWIGTKLMSSQWEVIRENAKLILNCGLRSIGKKTILCFDLFDNDFT